MARTHNVGISGDDYLAELDPDIVVEMHLACGGGSIGLHADAPSRPMPDEVWQWATLWAPRFRNLATITYEYRETTHRRGGLGGVRHELELIHDLATRIGEARAPTIF